MLIKPSLIAEAEQRYKQADFSPTELDKKLGDGPMTTMTVPDKQRRYRQLLTQTGDPEKAEAGLERIINGNDLDNINYLAKGTRCSRSICRIQLKDAGSNLIGYASGFLIGPGVLLTNHHVFGKPSDAANSLADFDYELDVNGMERSPVRFAFDPGKLFYTNDVLDFSVVAVAPVSVAGARNLSDWGWLPLNGEPGKADQGEYLTIIQHPGGQMKQVCVRDNKLLQYVGNFVWYMTDTTAGSSGSPAFNRFWQVVALHHSGVPKKNSKGQTLTVDNRVWDASIDESLIDWIANEGVRISAVVADMKSAVGTHPLVKAVLEAKAPPTPEELKTFGPSAPKMDSRGGNDIWVEQNGDSASLVIPVRVPVPWYRQDVPTLIAPVPLPPVPVGSGAPALVGLNTGLPIESVTINQKTLDSRPGYQPNFIGTGKFAVALPVIPAALKSKIVPLIKKPSQSELKYFNYSVVMNKDRRLAFYSVVNIDGGKQQDVGKREGDVWFTDPRIETKFQIGNEFYGKQATFEADRLANPFDRGHLVRRLDATWGSTVPEAKEHGDDSFHFTNCSPQFWSFNQGKQLWAGLEDYTRDVLLQNTEKGIVMNGPIFDGPDAAGAKLPDAGSASHKDPSFGGVKIPKYFWKILITKRSAKLSAAAFMISQRDLITKIERLHEADVFTELSAAQVHMFQVSMDYLSQLSQLDFGSLAQADTHEATSVGPRLIESYDEIRLV